MIMVPIKEALTFDDVTLVPKFSEIPYPAIMEPNLVVEYYSR